MDIPDPEVDYHPCASLGILPRKNNFFVGHKAMIKTNKKYLQHQIV